MPGGGLMMLVAYATLDQNNNYRYSERGEWNGFEYKYNNKGKSKFFYKNKKSHKKKKTESDEKSINNVKPKANLESPGYVYTPSSDIKYTRIFKKEEPPKPAPVIHDSYYPTTTVKKRANKNFKWRFIDKMNEFIKKKIKYNKKLLLLKKNNFSNKHKYVDIAFKINDINKKKILKCEYFIRLFGKKNIVKQWFYNISLESIFRLRRTIFRHTEIISLIVDYYNNDLPNVECPLTLEIINGKYLQCTTCKMCYNYTENIKNWFMKRSICSYCTNRMDMTIKYRNTSSYIYGLLQENYN